ncbi:hypothetical protein Droror1_Dr00016543 [Drosera rotundifolia]
MNIAAISEADIIEIAWGLEASKVPFLWVIRSGLTCCQLTCWRRSWKDTLPTNMDMIVEDRGCIVSWVSQKRVLAHPAVGGFWRHCDWNSTLDPFFGDQFADARLHIPQWSHGLVLLPRRRLSNIPIVFLMLGANTLLATICNLVILQLLITNSYFRLISSINGRNFLAIFSRDLARLLCLMTILSSQSTTLLIQLRPFCLRTPKITIFFFTIYDKQAHTSQRIRHFK